MGLELEESLKGEEAAAVLELSMKGMHRNLAVVLDKVERTP